MQPVHRRMPLILNEGAQAIWLNSTSSKEQLIALMKPYPYKDLEGYRVTLLMNKADFDHPLAIEPLSH